MKQPIFTFNETQKYIIDDNLAVIYDAQNETELLNWLVTPPDKTYLRVNTDKTTRQELIEEIKNVCGKEVLVQCYEFLDDVVVITTDDTAGQNLNDDAIPTEFNIVVGSGCAASVLRGAEVFAPGVLGSSPGLSKGDQVSVFADLNNELLKGATKFNIEGYLKIGIGTAELSRSDLFKLGIQSGVAVKMTRVGSSFLPSQGCLSKLPQSTCPRVNDFILEHVQGKYLMQNLPSILTVHQLDILDESAKKDAKYKCLDMCAAPGGKTTHIASLLGKQGLVLAFDKSMAKIQQINNMAKRFQLQDRIDAQVQDATKVDLDTYGTFDKILLDAPCSALGQRPMLCQKSQVKELKSFPKLQKKLFDKAFQLLKPQGVLVYSTCTITLDENENLVKWALEKFKNHLKLVPTFPILGLPGFGLGDEAIKVQRFGPGNQDSTIGYFLAKFQKI